MKFKYILEALTFVAIVAFFVLFLYTNSGGAEFAGSDNAGSRLITELTGTSLENFQPLIPQWVPRSPEIESTLFALQAAIGGVFVGGIFGYWIGQKKST